MFKNKSSSVNLFDQTERHLNEYIIIGLIKQGAFSFFLVFCVSFVCLFVLFIYLVISNKCRADMETQLVSEKTKYFLM